MKLQSEEIMLTLGHSGVVPHLDHGAKITDLNPLGSLMHQKKKQQQYITEILSGMKPGYKTFSISISGVRYLLENVFLFPALFSSQWHP